MQKLLWFGVSLLAAIAFGAIALAVNHKENINALWLLVAAVCVYCISYRYYSAFIAAKVLALDPRRVPASVRLNDGHDYHPTNKWILFGHHFAAISGAGPIIGPTLAAQFGYLPGFLWILIGATLGGAIHDMIVLAASVRRNGKSLAQIVKDELGPLSGLAIALAILFNMIVAVAGSGLAVVNALANSPWGTFTVLLTIPIAMMMGGYLRYLRPGKVKEVSIVGAVLLLAAVYFGSLVPGSWLAPYLTVSKNWLILYLAILCFFSSSLPVWLLLLPRDYISAYIKIGTFALLVVGIVVMAPTLKMPAVTVFAQGGGPIIPGTLYPFLFITIACGAVSGFHALITTGTTPKMIGSETDIRMVGFGAMLTESLVALVSLIAACALAPGDYFTVNTVLSSNVLTGLGFAPQETARLSAAIGTDVAGRPGGSVSLAVGMTKILAGIIGGERFMPYWYNFCLMFQALFILTLVDAGTRVGRMLIQELGGYIYKPIAVNHTHLNISITSLIVVLLWGYLLYAGSVATIWPMFGVANQILASAAFGAGTSILIKAGKARYCWVTLLPMVFMAVTSFTAAFQLVGIFYEKSLAGGNPAEALNLRVNIALILSMMALGILIMCDMAFKWVGYLRSREPLASSEVIEYALDEKGQG